MSDILVPQSKDTIVPQVLNEIETANYICMSQSYLRKCRMGECGPGPKFLKIGRTIRYRVEDLNAWLDSHSQVG